MSVQHIPCDGLSKKYCVLLRFQFGVTQRSCTYCSGFIMVSLQSCILSAGSKLFIFDKISYKSQSLRFITGFEKLVDFSATSRLFRT